MAKDQPAASPGKVPGVVRTAQSKVPPGRRISWRRIGMAATARQRTMSRTARNSTALSITHAPGCRFPAAFSCPSVAAGDSAAGYSELGLGEADVRVGLVQVSLVSGVVLDRAGGCEQFLRRLDGDLGREQDA